MKLWSPSLWPRECPGPVLIRSCQTFTLEPSIGGIQVVHSYQLPRLSFSRRNGFLFHPLPLWVLGERALVFLMDTLGKKTPTKPQQQKTFTHPLIHLPTICISTM